MLLEARPARVERFLDLGTGDGRLIAPSSTSATQTPEASALTPRGQCSNSLRRVLPGDCRVELREHDLADPLNGPFGLDAVGSALAIHHLVDERKRALFREVHALIAPGGGFVNLDLVASPTAEIHERFRQALGRERDDPTDHLAGLCEQLGWLRDAGFEQSDCRFKWLELAVVVAVRPSGKAVGLEDG
jgi:tRNA (cmo5U34)-methyltransferase